MKRSKVLLVMLLIMAFCTHAAAADESDINALITQSAMALSSAGAEPGTKLADQGSFPAGNSANDWTACILSHCGSSEYYAEYLEALQKYVENSYEDSGYLHNVKSTEYHRIILTVMALGGDPENFGSKPDGTPINLIADGTYNYIGESLGLQGLNGWIWALIVLNSSDVRVPENAAYQPMDIVGEILAAQEKDGGFGLDKGSSDIDITAMALQALAPYREYCPEEITNALNWLSLQLDDECKVNSSEEAGSESIAQIIMALCALGIDPEGQTTFVRGDNTLLTALNRYRLEDGSYVHTIDEEAGNSMSTCQALEALLSIQSFHQGAGFVFSQGYIIPNQNTNPIPDFASDKQEENVSTVSSSSAPIDSVKTDATNRDVMVPLIVIIGIAAVVVVVMIIRKRKSR